MRLNEREPPAHVETKILAGENVPKEIALGSRVFTRENGVRGGELLR